MDEQPQETIWTTAQIELYNTFKGRGASLMNVARRLGMDYDVVRKRFLADQENSPKAQEERDIKRRQDAYMKLTMQPRTITQTLCGDPLPGRSGLDQKRSVT